MPPKSRSNLAISKGATAKLPRHGKAWADASHTHYARMAATTGRGIQHTAEHDVPMPPQPVWSTTSKSIREPPMWTLPPSEQVALNSQARAVRDGEKSRLEFADGVHTAHSELEDMWQNTKINRFYEPISKLPRLGPLDPRKIVGRSPPRCSGARPVPRHARIMARWQSMPSIKPQLPQEDLEHIQRATSTSQESTVQAALRRGQEKRREAQAMTIEEICADVKDPKSINISWQEQVIYNPLTAPVREKLFVPCTCCDRARPKPWLDKQTVGAAAIAFVTEALERPAGGAGMGLQQRRQEMPEVCGTCGGTPVASFVGGVSASLNGAV